MTDELQDQKELEDLIQQLRRDSSEITAMLASKENAYNFWAAREAVRLFTGVSWLESRHSDPRLTVAAALDKIRKSPEYLQEYIKLSILRIRAEKL